MEKFYTVSKNKIGSYLVQIMNSLLPNSDLKKVGKATRPLRYDLNQMAYDYSVEATNRLDLIECQKNYVWSFVTLYRRR